MATLIAMPKLSDTMDEGIILKWLKKEGEAIKQGEILAEVQTDKADMELEAYDGGIVRKLFVPEGGGAPVGSPIAIIGTADEDISAMLQASGTASPQKSAHADSPAPARENGRLKASPRAKKLAENL